jgi:hypothetical protein
MQAEKPEQIRLRILPEDADTLESLTAGVLSRIDVASVLLHAACVAVRQSPGRVVWPPQFLPIERTVLKPGPSQLNEPGKRI